MGAGRWAEVSISPDVTCNQNHHCNCHSPAGTITIIVLTLLSSAADNTAAAAHWPPAAASAVQCTGYRCTLYRCTHIQLIFKSSPSLLILISQPL